MTLLRLHEEPLQDAWLDAYGHLNEAYYLVAFTNATWKLQAHFDIGTDYFDRTGNALYTLESHIRYLAEVRAPATLAIESMILGVDAKKLHIGHVMTFAGKERASIECLLLHYDSKAGRTAVFADDVMAGLRAAVMAEQPEWVGRSVIAPKPG